MRLQRRGAVEPVVLTVLDLAAPASLLGGIMEAGALGVVFSPALIAKLIVGVNERVGRVGERRRLLPKVVEALEKAEIRHA